MFETRKIDSFFSGEKNLLDEEEKIYISRRTKVVRFFKLFLPCLTALLLGLGVILFDFEANSDSIMPLNEEEKIYFEKFRMKNTTFEITEKDNQYSTLKAAVVEEIEPNSKIYNLTKPDAKSLGKDSVMTLLAENGVFDQNKQLLDLKTNVIASYNKDMEITTNSASYSFLTESGYGNEQIIGKGSKGYFKADKFTFDKKKGEATLINHVYMQSKDLELRSPDSATLFLNENKFVAKNSLAQKGKDTLKSDVLTVFFKDTKTFEIEKALGVGHVEIHSGGKIAYSNKAQYDADTGLLTLSENVKITSSSNYVATAALGIYDLNKKTFTLEHNVRIEKGTSVITAPKAVYFQNKEEFHFYGDITVTQEDGTAKAKRGVYYIKKNLAELENNVIIVKDGNEVRGDKAISDFATSKSRLVAKKGGRIFGKLIESTFKKNAKGK